MKKLALVCSLVALLLCSAAWLLGRVLSDYLVLDNNTLMLTEEELSEISDRLDLAAPADLSQTLVQLEQDFDIAIRQESRSNNADPVDNTTAAQLEDSGAPGNTPGSEREQTPLADDLDQLADLYGYDYPETLLIELDDGREFELLSLSQPPLLANSDYLQWLLQALAALGSIAFTVLQYNRRFDRLEALTRHALPTPAHSSSAAFENDPIEKAREALEAAQQKIDRLKEDRQRQASNHRDLLASVAHEFRSPLARLQFANEMAMEREGEEQVALFDEANNAANELDELVRETLYYSRLGSEDTPLRLETVSTEDVLRELARLAPPAGDKNSAAQADPQPRLQIEYPLNDMTIEADRRLLDRALGNLITNALRHARHCVTLSASMVDHTVRFVVEDDGPGIPTVHHARLFEPFYRVEASRSRNTGGFGLGLSIVKSICDRHGATLHLDSDNRGTRFIIHWPAA